MSKSLIRQTGSSYVFVMRTSLNALGLFFIFICLVLLSELSEISYFQTVITQINHAIGASGVISQECKSVVSIYGKTILEMLLNEVFVILHFSFSIRLLTSSCLNLFQYNLRTVVNRPYIISLRTWILLQAEPQQICSKIGLCSSDGTRDVRWDLICITKIK